MTATTQFIVAPVAVTVEGISLPGGAMIAVELAEPRHRHAILAHQPGGDVEIIAMYPDEREAKDALADMLLRLAEAERQAGATVQ
ncbi:hypothetical protein [Ancylobacter oerskovii]|uniref:Uncharacterized protein n=1 Tax=Ancylobacter oerskovii TaxID=459519 RepID=A0ABW4Z4H3_9HYPH|nr:hypothetical protein [Ancylobacter oerskovii]MBS7545720.1 hypothetical protein [Ancylobacter oerskovii]